MAKVFVSSTYVDLKEHRIAVDKQINRMGSSFRGMEYFGSRPYEPKEVCYQAIDECEVFIGIYAHRYGIIPKGERKSITELEFDYATIKGLKRFCYVVDPEFAWPFNQIEHRRRRELLRFHKKVANLVRSQFTTPDNLASQVAGDLARATGAIPESKSSVELLADIARYCSHEIDLTIGRKYVRGLYVGRALVHAIRNEIWALRRIKPMIARLLTECSELTNVTQLIFACDAPDPTQRVANEITKSVEKSSASLRNYLELRINDQELCYPALRLYRILTNIREMTIRTQNEVMPTLLRNDSIARKGYRFSICQDLTTTDLPPFFGPVITSQFRVFQSIVFRNSLRIRPGFAG